MKTVQTIYDITMERRVVVFECDDGSFGFEEQRFSHGPLEMCWIPVGKPPRPNCHYDTAERATFEARGHIHWLSESSVAHTPLPATGSQRRLAL
jgi:hypothetical protein